MRGNPNDTLTSTPTVFVRTGSSITVTIGRNVGDVPLTDDRWQEFGDKVVDHLSALVKPSFTFTYFGIGEWQGVGEESAAILLGGTEYTTDARNVDAVLSNLATEFGQDAIGWTFGESRLAINQTS